MSERRFASAAAMRLPRSRVISEDMPKKRRRLACDSAILAKLLSGAVVVVDELAFEAPKTREFARVLTNLKIDRSCLVTIPQLDMNVYKSARNLPKVDVRVVGDLNAGIVCNKQKVLFTKEAFMSLLNRNQD